jgi:hypothetical protein
MLQSTVKDFVFFGGKVCDRFFYCSLTWYFDEVRCREAFFFSITLTKDDITMVVDEEFLRLFPPVLSLSLPSVRTCVLWSLKKCRRRSQFRDRNGKRSK